MAGLPANRIFGSRLAVMALLFVMVVAAYSSALPNGFVWDDHSQVLSNPWIEDVRNVPTILSSSVWGFEDGFETSNYYRPTMHLVYMAEHSLFGKNPFGWHVINVLLHAMNAIVAYLLILRLAKDDDGFANIFAFMGASIFALHTINSEVPAFVAAVPELLLFLFYMTAFMLYARSVEEKSSKLLWLSALAFFIAILSKEPAITFGPMLVAFDLYKGRRPWKFECIKRYLAFAAALLAYMIMRTYAMGAPGLRSAKHADLTTWQSALNSFQLAAKYLKSMVLPINLSPFHVFEPFYSITEPMAAASVIMVAATLAIAIWLSIKVSKLFILSLAIFFIPLSLALYVPVLGLNAFSEVYVYLPSMGFALFCAVVLRNINFKAALLAYLIIIALLGISTFKRNFDWKDDFTIWKKTVENQPDNFYALYTLAGGYKGMGDNAKAIEALNRSVEANLKMRRPEPFSIGNARLMLAEIFMQEGLYLEAAREYLGAIEVAPKGRRPPNVDYNLAVAYQKGADLSNAAAAYVEALKYAQSPADLRDIYNNLGNVFMLLGNAERAAVCYNEVLKLYPGDPAAMHNLALAKGRR